jgi:hypothetical protein
LAFKVWGIHPQQLHSNNSQGIEMPYEKLVMEPVGVKAGCMLLI